MIKPLRWGMVGGGEGAFIGNVHRMAARLDGRYQLIAAAPSSNAERAQRSGVALNLAADRVYATVDAMIAGECNRDDGVEVVSVVTPNALHYSQCKALLQAGIDVVCDKPLTTTLSDAQQLVRLAKEKQKLLGVTFNYTGYPMIRHAKQLIARGELGEIRMVHVQYAQSWLASPLELTGHKQASWRTDKSQAGAGCLGDIGSHAFQLAEFVSGCVVEKISGDIETKVTGRKIDDNVQLLLRFSNGASGMLWASQVAHGHGNDLQLRVYGSEGSIQWRQESPEQLLITRADQSTTQVARGATGTPTSSTGLPGGHPEGFIEAFAQLYADYAEQLIAHREQRVPSAASLLAPTGEVGMRVMSFIDTALQLRDGEWSIVK